MEKKFIFTILFLVIASVLTAGCTTEDTKQVQDNKDLLNMTGMYVPAPVSYNIDGSYSIVSFVGYSKNSGFSYDPFSDEIVISGQNDRLFTLTDSYGTSYYAVYDKAGTMVTSYSAKNSTEPWQIYGQIVSDSEIWMAFAGILDGSLYADSYAIVKDGKEASNVAYPVLTGIWDVTQTESGSKNMTIVKMDGPVFYGSYSVITDNVLTKYDFVGAVYAVDENALYAVSYDEEGDFGKIEVSGEEFVWNWINEDGAFTDVYVKSGTTVSESVYPELADISGDYKDQYYAEISADGFVKDYSDYAWSLLKTGNGIYINVNNGTDTGFLQQYPDNSVFYTDNGYYYNGWVEDGVIYTFVADEEGADMYVSPRISQ
ncbi:MAG: hypothetical protein JXQ82_03305 [Methanomicrobiaceae archaeon]|nr:hypothetical protein [Methanomicrobiaceae archaeon]